MNTSIKSMLSRFRKVNSIKMSNSDDFENLHLEPRKRMFKGGSTWSLTVPTCASFGNALVSCFNSTGKISVEYWACCLKPHNETSGHHYHVCVKLSGPKRWNKVRNALIEKHGVVVNFSESDENYYSAYK